MIKKIVSVIIIEIAIFLLPWVYATTYNVGDGLNWVEPPTSTTYSLWASTHVFAKGDILVFNFNTGVHNVAEVTKENYKKCKKSSIISLNKQSPARIPLQNKGKRYFISTLNNDCQNGLKLAISVLQQLPPPSPPPTLSSEIAPGASNPIPSSSDPFVTPPPPYSRSNSAPLYFGYNASFLCVFLSLILRVL